MAQTAFNVYQGTKLIDTVFYSGKVSADDVRRSLIDHDGYDSRIKVVKRKVAAKTTRSNPAPTRGTRRNPRLSASQSIIVKFHGPTDSRGSRWTAKASSAPGSVTVAVDYALDHVDNAAAAAKALAAKLGWKGTWHVGSLGEPGYVFVLTDASSLAFKS